MKPIDNKNKNAEVDQLLRVKHVSAMTTLGKSTIWLWVSKGKFPAPIKLSPRVTVWQREDIQDWIK